MQGLFLEYKDPLFGIIVFVSIIFFIALVTYLWNIYSYRYSNRHIIEFVNAFNPTEKPSDIQALLDAKELPLESLELLAYNYYKAGQYETCIEIALDILKRRQASRKETLLLLAKAYYKAGFYKRSESTLVELLRYSTREPQALEYLILIYEKLQRFNDALDALDSLKEMDVDISDQTSYIQVVQTIRNATLDQTSKAQKLFNLYEENPKVLRPVFMHLFRTDPKQAWHYMPLERYSELIDILWNLSKEVLDLDIIAQHEGLQALFFAKGYYDKVAQSEIFEINILNTLAKNSENIASLQFSYVCDVCRESTPLMNHRCPHCMTLLSLHTQITLVEKKHIESYYSF